MNSHTRFTSWLRLRWRLTSAEPWIYTDWIWLAGCLNISVYVRVSPRGKNNRYRFNGVRNSTSGLKGKLHPLLHIIKHFWKLFSKCDFGAHVKQTDPECQHFTFHCNCISTLKVQEKKICMSVEGFLGWNSPLNRDWIKTTTPCVSLSPPPHMHAHTDACFSTKSCFQRMCTAW